MILQDKSVLVIIDMQKVSLADGLYPVYNIDNLVNKIKKVIDELGARISGENYKAWQWKKPNSVPYTNSTLDRLYDSV